MRAVVVESAAVACLLSRPAIVDNSKKREARDARREKRDASGSSRGAPDGYVGVPDGRGSGVPVGTSGWLSAAWLSPGWPSSGRLSAGCLSGT